MNLSLVLTVFSTAAWAGATAWAGARRAMGSATGGASLPFTLLVFALLLSTAWAGATAALAFQPLWTIDGAVLCLDGLHSLAWMAWLLVLLGAQPHRRHWPSFTVPIVLAAALGLAGLASVVAGAWSREQVGSVRSMSGLVLAIGGLILVEQLYRNASDDRRWNAKPLCLGLAVGWGFDVYVFAEAMLLRRPDWQALQLRPVIASLGVPLLLLGLGRGGALMASLQVSRQVVFHSATLLLSGGYLVLVSGLGYWVRYSGGDWGPVLQLLLLVAGVLGLAVVAFSGAVRAKLRVWVAKSFFRYRYDYRDEWLRFTAALSSSEAPGRMGETVVRALADLVESPAGGLWLRRGDEPSLTQAASWNFDRGGHTLAVEGCMSDLAQRLWIADLDDCRRGQGGEGVPPPDWLLHDRQAWLVIPLVVAGRLHGAVVLAHPRTPLALDWEVRDLLKTAASQAAGALAMLQASERLLEAQKFEAFNRMSAFVVHDLKNIVTQLSLMMKNAERHGDNPEFRRDMNDTVNHAVDKMRQLMLQLREGARPTGISSGVSLSAIADRLRSAAQQRGRVLDVQCVGAVETRGVEERIERVIGHAVQNAFDASRDDQPVRLQVDAVGSYARVRVADEGVGMSADFVRDRLFKPFQSTKEHGMGIGAFESRQYVHELGGKMEVSSEPGRGTTLTFLLPLFHSQSQSTPLPG
jgi:putative PEP-CTERM system histidine kinase